MIKRSCLYALALLLIYAAYVSYGNPSPVVQHQWQDNVVRTQLYSYTDSLHKRDVIIGTSLTAMLDPALLPKDLFMLTYPGMSVINGLVTLKENDVVPKYVFIELNAITRPVNTKFNDYIFGDINFYSKKYLPFLRDCYQPMGQVAGFVERHGSPRIQFVSDWCVNPAFRLLQGDTVATIDKEAHYRAVKRGRNMVDTAALIANFELLKQEVSWLETKGSKIYFFETPTHPEVFRTKQRELVISNFEKYFPRDRFHYFATPDISQYGQLHDQLHLDPPSAIKYAHVFSNEINEARKVEN